MTARVKYLEDEEGKRYQVGPADGGYWFVIPVKNVRNIINVKSKSRDELICIWIPFDKVDSFLKNAKMRLCEMEVPDLTFKRS